MIAGRVHASMRSRRDPGDATLRESLAESGRAICLRVHFSVNQQNEPSISNAQIHSIVSFLLLP
jgi:hypothetical protein